MRNVGKGEGWKINGGKYHLDKCKRTGGCLQILVFHYDKILPIKFISPKLELFGSIRIGEIGWKEVGTGVEWGFEIAMGKMEDEGSGTGKMTSQDRRKRKQTGGKK